MININWNYIINTYKGSELNLTKIKNQEKQEKIQYFTNQILNSHDPAEFIPAKKALGKLLGEAKVGISVSKTFANLKSRQSKDARGKYFERRAQGFIDQIRQSLKTLRELQALERDLDKALRELRGDQHPQPSRHLRVEEPAVTVEPPKAQPRAMLTAKEEWVKHLNAAKAYGTNSERFKAKLNTFSEEQLKGLLKNTKQKMKSVKSGEFQEFSGLSEAERNMNTKELRLHLDDLKANGHADEHVGNLTTFVYLLESYAGMIKDIRLAIREKPTYSPLAPKPDVKDIRDEDIKQR